MNYNLALFWVLGAFSIVIKYYRLKDVDRYNLNLAYWMAGMLMMIIFSIPRWYPHDGCIAFNGFYHFMQYMQKKYRPSFDPNKSLANLGLDLALRAFNIMVFLAFILITIILIYEPRGLVFLGDLIPEHFFILPVRILVILFHTYVLVVMHLSGVCVINCSVVYAFYIVPIYTQEFNFKFNRYKMRRKLRAPENIRHAYRGLQIVQTNTFFFLGLFVLIINAWIMATCQYCTFVLIRYWDRLQFVSKGQLLMWVVAFVGFWTFILELGRFVYSRGTKGLTSWKMHDWGNMSENKLMKKFSRSCQPLVISYGSQFVVKKKSVLVFYRGITRGTFRALLATKTSKIL